MAQIIKHRRGSITSLKDVTANIGEFVIATGSIGNLNAPIVFVGSDATAGGYKAVSKIYQGSIAPVLGNDYGTVMDGTPFYSSTSQSLYILDRNGNINMDLSGNLEGNTISGITINNITGSRATFDTYVSSSALNVTGNTQMGGTLNVEGSTTINNNLTVTGTTSVSGITNLGSSLNVTGSTTLYSATTINDKLTVTGTTNANGGLNVTGSVNISGATSVTGALNVSEDTTFQKDLYVSGNIYQTGSFFTQGDIVLSGSINIGNSLTGDTINFGGEVNSHIIPTTNNTFDLGTSAKAWKDLYVSGTAYIENINIGEVSLTNLALPGDLTVSGTTILSGSVYVEDLTDNRIVLAGVGGELEDDANLTFDGTTFKIGNGDFEVDVLSGDTRISGSLIVKNSATVTGSLFATNIEGTGSLYLQADQTDGRYFEIYNTAPSDVHIKSNQGLSFFGDDTNYLLINDSAQTATIVGVNGVFVSSSLGVTGSLGVSGSVNISGGASVTGAFTVGSGSMTSLGGDLYVSGNLQVLGSQTNVNIESNTVNIGDNIIQVNAYSPFQRYAGVSAYDSGSAGNSGSLLWDSTNNYWLFQNDDGTSSKIVGVSSGTFGSEASLTSGTFPIATTGNTIGDSLLTYSGTTLSLNGKFSVDSDSGETKIEGNLNISYSGATMTSGLTSNVLFINSNDDIGFISSTDTTSVTDRLLGYNTATGNLEFSSLIDGGQY